MKILILGTGKLDCAAANCGVALRAMGHEVRHFDPDEHPSYIARVRRSWEKRIVNRLLSFAVDQGRLWEPALTEKVRAPAHREHTHEKRLSNLLEVVGLS